MLKIVRLESYEKRMPNKLSGYLIDDRARIIENNQLILKS